MSTPRVTVPETVAEKADVRALEIFEAEARFGKTFRECLGMIWMMGIQAGYEAANAVETDQRPTPR